MSANVVGYIRFLLYGKKNSKEPEKPGKTREFHHAKFVGTL